MDTVSAGATVAWAMECFERGLLTVDDTDGLDLRFGNAPALLECLERIATRNGKLGQLLSDGSRHASSVLGRGSDHWAMHVKGLEMPGYEPRSLKTMALALAVSTRGACHNRSSAYEADFSNRVNRLEADAERGKSPPTARTSPPSSTPSSGASSYAKRSTTSGMSPLPPSTSLLAGTSLPTS